MKKLGTICILLTAVLGIAAFVVFYYPDLVAVDYDYVFHFRFTYTGQEVLFGIKDSNGAEYTTNPTVLALIAWIMIGVGAAVSLVANIASTLGFKAKILCFVGGGLVLAGGIMCFFIPATFAGANPIDGVEAVASATQMLTTIAILTTVGGAAGLVGGLVG